MVPAPDRDRDRFCRAGPDPAPHTALAAILPSAANFARQLKAVPAVLILEEAGAGGWRAGSGAAAGRGRGCRGSPGRRRSQGLHKSLFQTLEILSLETEIKRMIPVSGTRRTESSPLGIVHATGLLPEPSPNTFVVLKGRTSEFCPACCSERLHKAKKIIFQVHLKKTTPNSKLKNTHYTQNKRYT